MANEYNGQNYLWIADYKNSGDIEVTGKHGEKVVIENPRKVMPLPNKINEYYNEANNSRDRAKQQQAIAMVIRHFNIDKLNTSKSFWSIAPRATQQEMVEFANERFVGSGSVELNPTPTMH